MLAGLDDMLDVGGNRIRPEKKDIWKVVLWVIGVLGIFILLGFEFKWFSRMFNPKSFLLIAAVIGAIVGALIGYSVSKSAKTTLDRAQITIMIAVMGAIAMPVFASLSNRLLGSETTEQVEFTKIEAIREAKFDLPKDNKPDAYFLYITRDNAIQKFKVKEDRFVNAKHGSKIDLPIIDGLWGYDLLNLK